MVTELKEAIKKVELLPEEEQRLIARIIDNEMQWEEVLAISQDQLARLAQEAIEEHQAGRTKQADW